MIEIKPQRIPDSEVQVPGSKSYTHRILIACALSDGACTIENALRSEDTLLTLGALRSLGARIEDGGKLIRVHGTKGRLTAGKEPVYLGNSGTSMRLLTGVATLAEGRTVLTGTRRMRERPIGDLLDGLEQMGVSVRSVEGTGCPPIEIDGGSVRGGKVGLRCKVSSQYLSALLLTGPYTREGLEVTVTEGPVSRPYVDMTVDVMKRLGVDLEREGYELFRIRGGQVYRAGDYSVEPDASQAGYFWAAAAVTGATVKVKGITGDSRQGDVRLADLFERMGCRITKDSDGIAVTGGPLSAIETDMADMPDMVPTLAVVAAYAEGTTIIKNVSHLRAKESDRLTAVATELTRMGIDATVTETGLRIVGGRPRGAEIETYDDHRMAMCFAVAGLVTPGVSIRDEMCVRKSFPNFWEVFNGLY